MTEGVRHPEHATWSRRDAWFLGATIATLGLVPWTVSHWPSQDGPNHLAVAHVVATYAENESPFTRFLSVHRGFRPSTATYEILAAASRVVSLDVAERCLVSVALVLLPASLFLLVRRNLPQRQVNVFLGLPFVLGWALGMGFLSFELAMAFGVLALAVGWQPSSTAAPGVRVGWRHALASLAFFLSVAFHPFAAVIAGLLLMLLEWQNLLQVRQWPRLLLVLLPGAAFLVLSYFAAGPPSDSSAAHETDFSDPVGILVSALECCVSYSPFELVPRLAALLLVIPFVYRSVRAHAPHREHPEAAIGRAVLALLVLFCVTPTTLHGWYFCSARFLLYAWVLLPVAAVLPASIARRAVWLGPALTAIALAIQLPVINHASRQLQDVLDVGRTIPPGAKVLPADLETSVFGPQPMCDAWAELVVERDAVASQLFAAGRPRMGGERLRTLTFLPGVLDAKSGTLPWSGFSIWSDVWQPCADPWSPVRWFVHVDGTCDRALAARRHELDPVVDRYDYVLVTGPPDYMEEVLASRVRLFSQVGSARLYSVVH